MENDWSQLACNLPCAAYPYRMNAALGPLDPLGFSPSSLSEPKRENFSIPRWGIFLLLTCSESTKHPQNRVQKRSKNVTCSGAKPFESVGESSQNGQKRASLRLAVCYR